VTRAYAASSRGDYDVALLGYDEKLELRLNETDLVGPDLVGVHKGRDAFPGLVEAWRDAWEDFRFQPEEVLDFGSGVIVTIRIVGRGKGSGILVDLREFDVLFASDNGKVIRHDIYRKNAEALEAAGVSAQDAQAGS
jgi:ketosteroid isomerase-like protein